MTVETKPMLPAITPSGEPWEPKTLEVLEDYPEQKYNVLVPTQAVSQVNPYLVPDIQVVQLVASENSRDVYHDSQMKQGHYAPTASALRKIADTAGINEVSSKRTDDGKNPDVVEWTVVAERQLPSGQTVRAHGSKRVDLTAMSFASEAHKKRTRQFMLENAQTKALNRAIRSLLSLHGSYPLAQLAKPFAVLRWVPNMAHPDVQRAFLNQLAPAAALFGPPADAPQLAPTAAAPQIEMAAEAPEDDPAPDARADVDPDGVVVEEPDWGTPSEAAATTSDDEPPEPRILVSLRERAEASELKGAPTPAQREQLKSATTGIGNEAVMRVLGALWELTAPSGITAAQAEAILDVAEIKRPAGQSFAAEWRAAAAWLKEGEGQ